MPTLTDIDISSQSLVRLGDKSINDFEETFGGEVCGSVYPFVKEKVITSHPWRATMVKSTVLNQLVEKPKSEYQFQYQLPPDMEWGPRTVWNSPVDETGNKSPFKLWDIFGDKLLTDSSFIKVDYQIDIIEALFPPYLKELMVLALMAEIAFAVTDQQNTADAAFIKAWGNPGENMKGGYFLIASRLDSQSRPPSKQRSFPLTAVRPS